jgi:hypothetical protein
LSHRGARRERSRKEPFTEEIAVAEAAGEPSARGAAAAEGGDAAGRERRSARDRRENAARARDVEVASGSFEGVSGHSGTGRAAVIELAEGGRVITFSDFEVDPGAGGQDLRVWLSAGSPESDSAATDDYVEIAPLRGESGNQQYDVPKRVDLERYSTVVVWCVPFTTRIAQAELG